MKHVLLSLILAFATHSLWAQQYERYTGPFPEFDSSFKVQVALPVNLAMVVGQVESPASIDGRMMQVMTCGQSPYVVTMGPNTWTTLKDIDFTFDGTDYHYGVTGFTHDNATPNDNDIIFLVVDDNDAAALEYSIRIGSPGDDDRGYGIIEIPPLTPNTISFLVCGSTTRASGDHDGLVFRVDVDFTSWTHNIPWMTTIGGPGGDDYAFAMAYDPAMGANTGFVTGEARSMLCNGAFRNAFVTGVDLTTGGVIQQTLYCFMPDMVGRSLDYDPASGLLVMCGQAAWFGSNPDGFVMTLFPLSPILLPFGMSFINVPGSSVDVHDAVANPAAPTPGITVVGSYLNTAGLQSQGFAAHFDCVPILPALISSAEFGDINDEHLFGIDCDQNAATYYLTGETNRTGSDDIYYCTPDFNLSLTLCPIPFSPLTPSIGVVYNVNFNNTPIMLTDFPGPTMSPILEPMTLVCGPVCKAGNPGEGSFPSGAANNHIHLAPVPAQNALEVTFAGEWNQGFDLFDVAGKKLKSFTGESLSVQIDLSDFASGTYYLRRQAANGEWVHQKFIKQ